MESSEKDSNDEAFIKSNEESELSELPVQAVSTTVVNRNFVALESELDKVRPNQAVVHSLLNIGYAARLEDIAASKPEARKSLILTKYRAFKMFPVEVYNYYL